MKSKLLDNWLLKLGSLLCAVILWLVVFNITDPINTLRIYDVKVQLLNTDLILDNNQVFEVLGGTDVVQSISIQAHNSVINELKDSDIIVEADFNKLTMDGMIELNAYTTRHTAEIAEIKLSNDTLQVSVENIAEKYFPVSLNVVGETASGYVVNNKSINQNQIYVTGPESVVSAIKQVGAIVDLSDTRGDITTYADLVLYDEEGAEISQDRLTMNVKQILATVEVWATKEIPVSYIVAGEAGDGFAWTGEISSNYENINIKGESIFLDAISELVIQDEVLSVEGEIEDVVLELDIDEYLPKGIVRNDMNQGGKLDITLSVEPILTREEEVSVRTIKYINVPQNYTVTPTDLEQKIKVILQSIEMNLEDEEKSMFVLEVDIADLIGESDLEEGALYVVTPKVTIDDSIEAYTETEIEILIEPPTLEED